jgi:TatA/E family protein of Tat protein translocase
MMKPMNFSETIFLFVLALIIFGPKKLPEIARQIGKYMNEFKRASNEFKAQIEQEIAHLEVEKTPTILPPASSPEGTASRTLHAAPVEASASEALALPAGEAAAEDEPLFATQAAEPPSPSTETAIPSETAAPTSQESHV